MRTTICVLVFAALSAGSAFAAEAPSAASHATDAAAKSTRTLYICDSTAMTKRAFKRQFGAAEYVKAETATAKGQSWASPKCITAAEARRLNRMKLASLR